MGRHRLLTVEQESAVLHAHAAGRTQRETAETLGVAEHLVRGTLQRNGIKGGGRSSSLTKERLLAYVVEHGPFDGLDQMARDLGVDVHSLAHQLYAMRKRGLVTFRTTQNGTANGRMVGITAQRSYGRVVLAAPAEVVDEAEASVALDHDPEVQTLVVEPKEPEPEEPEPEPEEPEPEAKTEPEPERFDPVVRWPTIAALAQRRPALEAAARLAEVAGEDDLAVTLLERAAGESLPAAEREAIDMWHWMVQAARFMDAVAEVVDK